MRVSSTLIAALVLAAPAAASAQVYVITQPAPPAPPPPQVQAYAAPAPGPGVFMPRTYYPVVRKEPIQLQRDWGIGLRASSGALTSEARPDDPMELHGGALDLEWRASTHWSLDLEAAGWAAESKEGSHKRSIGLTTVGAAYHFTPYGRWDLYLSAGLGGGHTEVTYLNQSRSEITEEADVATVRLGLGLGYRFRNGLALAIEGRAAGIVRSDEDEPPIPADQDLRAIPHSNGQALLDVKLAYYF